MIASRFRGSLSPKGNLYRKYSKIESIVKLALLIKKTKINQMEEPKKIITISIPEYTLDTQPDYKAIGDKLDKILEANFNGRNIAIRAISTADHPQHTLDELTQIVVDTGTDKYDPNRKGVEGFDDYNVDFQAGFGTVGENLKGEGADIIQKFYENTLLDRGYRLRIDLLLIYDLSQLAKAEKYPGKEGVHPRLEPYLFKFRNPENKPGALIGVIKILR